MLYGGEGSCPCWSLTKVDLEAKELIVFKRLHLDGVVKQSIPGTNITPLSAVIEVTTQLTKIYYAVLTGQVTS